MDGRGMPTLDEARRINEAIVEAHLEANPGAFEAVAFAGERMEDALDLAEKATGMCAKAATLMCGTAWAQPFAGANKRTGVVLAKLMLNRSGFDFNCPGCGGGDRLRRLLFEIQGRRACLDPSTVAKAQVWMWPRLKRRGAEPLEDAVHRIISENRALFDYMARETPLPAELSAEEREANEMAEKCTDMAALGERVLRARNRHAASFTPAMIRLLIGPRNA